MPSDKERVCVVVKWIRVQSLDSTFTTDGAITRVQLVYKDKLLGCSPLPVDVKPNTACFHINAGWAPSFLTNKGTATALELEIKWITADADHSKEVNFSKKELTELSKKDPKSHPEATVSVTVSGLGTIEAGLQLVLPLERLEWERSALRGRLEAHLNRLNDTRMSERSEKILKTLNNIGSRETPLTEDEQIVEATTFIQGPMNDLVSSVTSVGLMVRRRVDAGAKIAQRVEEVCKEGAKFITDGAAAGLRSTFAGEEVLDWVDGCVDGMMSSGVPEKFVELPATIVRENLSVGACALLDVVSRDIAPVLKEVPLGGALFAAAKIVIKGIVDTNEVKEQGSKLAERMVVLLRMLNDPEVALLISKDAKAHDLKRMLAMILSTITAVGDLLEGFNKRGMFMKGFTSSSVLEELEELRDELAIGFSQFHDCLSLRVMASGNAHARTELKTALDLLETAKDSHEKTWQTVSGKLDALTGEIAAQQTTALEELRTGLKGDISRMIAGIPSGSGATASDDATRSALTDLQSKVDSSTSTLDDIKAEMLKLATSTNASEQAQKDMEKTLKKLIDSSSAAVLNKNSENLRDLETTMATQLNDLLKEITLRGVKEFEALRVITTEQAAEVRKKIEDAAAVNTTEHEATRQDFRTAMDKVREDLASKMESEVREMKGAFAEETRKMIEQVTKSEPLDVIAKQMQSEVRQTIEAELKDVSNTIAARIEKSTSDAVRAELAQAQAAFATAPTQSLDELRELATQLNDFMLEDKLNTQLANHFQNAKLNNVDGMYFDATADFPFSDAEMTSKQVRAVFKAAAKYYSMKYSSLGLTTGDSSLEAKKMYANTTLRWDDGTENTRGIDVNNIHAAVASHASKSRIFVIKGCAGSGKTAFARQLARIQQPEDGRFVVTVDLEHLIKQIPVNASQRIAFIQLIGMSMYNQNFKNGYLQLPNEKIQDTAEKIWTSQMPITWVLDGLDHIAPNLSSCAPFDLLLDGFLSPIKDNELWKNRPSDLVFITARDGVVNPFVDKLKNAPVVSLDPWSDIGISNYLESFFANSSPEAHRNAVEWIPNGSLVSFARFPALCECLCAEFRTGALPKNDTEVLKTVFEKLYNANRRLFLGSATVLYPAVEAEAVAKANTRKAQFELDTTQLASAALARSGLVRSVPNPRDPNGTSFVYEFLSSDVEKFFTPSGPPPVVGDWIKVDIAKATPAYLKTKSNLKVALVNPSNAAVTFYDHKGERGVLEEVDIAELDMEHLGNVHKIGRNFLANAKVKHVNLKGLENVSEIGDGFFYSCPGLESIDLTALTNVTSISDRFLCYNANLTALDVAPLASVATIGDDFLSNCGSLEQLDLRPLVNVTEVGEAFLLLSEKLAEPGALEYDKGTVIGDAAEDADLD